jgi:hypothetical protein
MHIRGNLRDGARGSQRQNDTILCTVKRDIKMHANPLMWLAVALLVYYLIWGRKGNGVIAREIRMLLAVKSVTAAYRAGDYVLNAAT